MVGPLVVVLDKTESQGGTVYYMVRKGSPRDLTITFHVLSCCALFSFPTSFSRSFRSDEGVMAPAMDSGEVTMQVLLQRELIENLPLLVVSHPNTVEAAHSP